MSVNPASGYADCLDDGVHVGSARDVVGEVLGWTNRVTAAANPWWSASRR